MDRQGWYLTYDYEFNILEWVVWYHSPWNLLQVQSALEAYFPEVWQLNERSLKIVLLEKNYVNDNLCAYSRSIKRFWCKVKIMEENEIDA